MWPRQTLFLYQEWIIVLTNLEKLLIQLNSTFYENSGKCHWQNAPKTFQPFQHRKDYINANSCPLVWKIHLLLPSALSTTTSRIFRLVKHILMMWLFSVVLGKKHLRTTGDFFKRLSEAKLTIDFSKSEFGEAQVNYLGQVVWRGQVKSVGAKVEDLTNFLQPENKKQIMLPVGMAGNYRRLCSYFATATEPRNYSVRRTKICLEWPMGKGVWGI